ncbi:RNase adapter RapZ [Ruminococcus sp. AF14-10]|nr:RNase adapter RapZ [Ruminococcus sp. AF14-10]
MRMVIVTGMSGAGKSTALKVLEDTGYFCVDNLPIPLFLKFVEMSAQPDANLDKVAIGIDIRGGRSFARLAEELDVLKEKEIPHEILYLDAGDDVLVKRYKETRRSHPLAKDGRLDKGIAAERKELEFLKMRATYIIDTSNLLTRELNQEIRKIFVEGKEYKNLYVTILSFGFKYGIPSDADLVFDVRFLPNPYYIEELKEKTGQDKAVQQYVMDNDKAPVFLEKVTDLLEFLLPNYILEGKNQLVIAVGCTGGKHRSVTLANAIYEKMKEKEDYGFRIEHRDITKDSITKAK